MTSKSALPKKPRQRPLQPVPAPVPDNASSHLLPFPNSRSRNNEPKSPTNYLPTEDEEGFVLQASIRYLGQGNPREIAGWADQNELQQLLAKAQGKQVIRVDMPFQVELLVELLQNQPDLLNQRLLRTNNPEVKAELREQLAVVEILGKKSVSAEQEEERIHTVLSQLVENCVGAVPRPSVRPIHFRLHSLNGWSPRNFQLFQFLTCRLRVHGPFRLICDPTHRAELQSQMRQHAMPLTINQLGLSEVLEEELRIRWALREISDRLVRQTFKNDWTQPIRMRLPSFHGWSDRNCHLLHFLLVRYAKTGLLQVTTTPKVLAWIRAALAKEYQAIPASLNFTQHLRIVAA